jgi:hypothetical protein
MPHIRYLFFQEEVNESYTIRFARVFSALVLVVVSAPLALKAQGQIQGQVVNGTAGKPVSNQVVQLLLPRGGMQQAASATTDAHGRFVFPQGPIDAGAFYLLQAVYQGVNYHSPVPFDSAGRATVNLTVYDTGATPSSLRVKSARLLVRAGGQRARVQEIYALENSSQPPRAYASSEVTFRFQLAPGAGKPTVAVAGLMNMPLPQSVVAGKARGEYGIQYALKPGLTLVMVVYETDYTPGKFTLADQVPYPVGHAELLVFPPSLTVDSTLFKPAGQDAETGSMKLEADNLPPRTSLEATLAGEAAASSEPEAGQADSQVKIVPNSMTRLGVPLAAGLLLILLGALGVRIGKEWPELKEQRGDNPIQKELEAQIEELFNSLADLDELHASGKVAEKKYWKERLELKARLVATLKKGPPSLRDSYALRHARR